jgi:hypothetical protein
MLALTRPKIRIRTALPDAAFKLTPPKYTRKATMSFRSLYCA